MSRAFVNEDAEHEPDPEYDLPDPNSPEYDEAAAWALIEGANAGNSRSAELATGYRWGAQTLVPVMEAILREAEAAGEDRTAQLARRFIRAATAS